jgi:hypothetical protein
MNSRKTERRTQIITKIMDALKDNEIFDRVKYKQKSESELQNRMATPLHRTVVSLYEEFKGYVPSTSEKMARINFASEEDPNTTVNNFVFMGVQHRPDFTIDFDDMKIAIEIKKGSCGKSIREGLGQSIVYNTHFDFVVYLFVDTSNDDRLKNSMNGDKERLMKKNLWEQHNVLFDIV